MLVILTEHNEGNMNVTNKSQLSFGFQMVYNTVHEDRWFTIRRFISSVALRFYFMFYMFLIMDLTP